MTICISYSKCYHLYYNFCPRAQVVCARQLLVITKVGGTGTRAHVHAWHRGGLRHRQATNWSRTAPNSMRIEINIADKALSLAMGPLPESVEYAASLTLQGDSTVEEQFCLPRSLHVPSESPNSSM